MYHSLILSNESLGEIDAIPSFSVVILIGLSQ